jgi:uncharacterized membrane protein
MAALKHKVSVNHGAGSALGVGSISFRGKGHPDKDYSNGTGYGSGNSSFRNDSFLGGGSAKGYCFEDGTGTGEELECYRNEKVHFGGVGYLDGTGYG